MPEIYGAVSEAVAEARRQIEADCAGTHHSFPYLEGYADANSEALAAIDRVSGVPG